MAIKKSSSQHRGKRSGAGRKPGGINRKTAVAMVAEQLEKVAPQIQEDLDLDLEASEAARKAADLYRTTYIVRSTRIERS